MKYFFWCTVCILISQKPLKAQWFKRSINFHVKSFKTDSMHKLIEIHYAIRNTDSRDSLSVSIQRINGQLIHLKEVYGAIGRNLTDGREKIIYWNPIAEHQKFNEEIQFIFNIKTINVRGIEFTRRQRFNVARWGICGITTAFTAYEGHTIDKLIKSYYEDYPPTNPVEKELIDSKMSDLKARQHRFLYFEVASAAIFLSNVIISIVDCKYKLKPEPIHLTATKTTIGLAYNF